MECVGIVAFLRQKNSNVVIVHCVIHRKDLVYKALPTILHSVMSYVIHVVNCIKISISSKSTFFLTS